MSKVIKEQIEWIQSGKIGCIFAAVLVRNHEDIGWQFQVNPKTLVIPDDCFILSVIFPDGDLNQVREWALENGMHLVDVNGLYQGLRVKVGENVSWVQYFGQDSHVKTRQSPHPMLSFTVKLPSKYYAKVGFKGILHLAHASVKGLSDKVTNIFWNQSFKRTEKELGRKPGVESAAKTTFKK